MEYLQSSHVRAVYKNVAVLCGIMVPRTARRVSAGRLYKTAKQNIILYLRFCKQYSRYVVNVRRVHEWRNAVLCFRLGSKTVIHPMEFYVNDFDEGKKKTIVKCVYYVRTCGELRKTIRGKTRYAKK